MCCLLKEIDEGTYKTKHAEAARLDYRTTQRHTDTNMNKYTPASTPKLYTFVKVIALLVILGNTEWQLN